MINETRSSMTISVYPKQAFRAAFLLFFMAIEAAFKRTSVSIQFYDDSNKYQGRT